MDGIDYDELKRQRQSYYNKISNFFNKYGYNAQCFGTGMVVKISNENLHVFLGWKNDYVEFESSSKEANKLAKELSKYDFKVNTENNVYPNLTQIEKMKFEFTDEEIKDLKTNTFNHEFDIIIESYNSMLNEIKQETLTFREAYEVGKIKQKLETYWELMPESIKIKIGKLEQIILK